MIFLTPNDEYFIRMMLPIIKEEVHSYDAEEKKILLDILENLIDKELHQLVVIGAGTLSYVEVATSLRINYVAVEPLINFYIQKELLFVLKQQSNISIIPENFGEFKENKLREGKRIFMFVFNVFAYIPNPIDKINQYLKKGDIIFISTWNLHSDKANDIRTKYFDMICKSMDVENLNEFKKGKTYDLNEFSFEKLNSYVSHKRLKGDITDILIIQS